MLVSSPIGASLLERRLLDAARAHPRDQHAMSLLLHTFWPIARALARRADIPPGVDRDDIEQAALSGVLGAIETWKPGRVSLATYVGICAGNAVKNALKKARAARNRPITRAVSLDALAELGREPACRTHRGRATTDPLDIVIINEEIDAITAAVPTLTDKEKTCWLGDLNGRSHADLAASSGATKRAVATAIDRARKKLKAAKENGSSARPSP
jgi:RNA polymerase sigma factor (sigma-70 family)